MGRDGSHRPLPVVLNFRVSDRESGRLRAEARARGMTLSNYLRLMLRLPLVSARRPSLHVTTTGGSP